MKHSFHLAQRSFLVLLPPNTLSRRWKKVLNPTLSANSTDEHGPKNATNFKVYIDVKYFMLPCFVSVHLNLFALRLLKKISASV